MQVYTAMYAPNTGPFLLLCATVPPLVAMVSMIVIRPIEAPKRKDDTDKSKFSTLYVSRDSGLHIQPVCKMNQGTFTTNVLTCRQ